MQREDGAAREEPRVSGRILLRDGDPAAGLIVRLYRLRFGGEPELVGEAETGPDGEYELPDASGEDAYQVRAVDPSGQEVALSRPMLGIPADRPFHLVAPVTVVERGSEFARLVDELAPHLGRRRLGEAVENDDRHDIHLLAAKIGRDPRQVALAAIADRLVEQAALSSKQTGLTREVAWEAVYGLVRSGLPTDPDRLAAVPPEALDAVFDRAREAGVVALDGRQVNAAKRALAGFARQRLLDGKPDGALSSVSELLDRSGLDRRERATFEQLLVKHRGGGAALWEEAIEQRIRPEMVERLRLQGKLAFLTRRNAELTDRLVARAEALARRAGSGPVDGLADVLVNADLFRPERWERELRELAGDDPDRLAALIPPAYQGKTVEDRLAAYARDQAMTVRVSYPTRVVGRLVETGAMMLGGLAPTQHDLTQRGLRRFFERERANGLDFRLGHTPPGVFLRDHHEIVFAGVGAEEEAATSEAVRTLHRMYQVTPTDEAMSALLADGFTNAQDVVALPEREFVDRYRLRLGVGAATLVHRKAQQIDAVTTNALLGIPLLLPEGQQPDLPSPPSPLLSIPGLLQPQLTLPLNPEWVAENFPTVGQLPGLEALFGSLDYGGCQHCRSVLSPAAYLVDLFQLLREGASATPYERLVERRPDLPHLPLTCENTHTVLPYIDVVNEILEYAVAHQTLDEGAVRDVGGADSEDLLAEPQHLIAEAYELLAGETYPLGLPFDLWMETTRQFLDSFGTPLWMVLDAARTTGDLHGDGDRYGLAEVFTEYLGLSPTEQELVTGATAASLAKLYGYPGTTAARAELRKAKPLARRLGISYLELAEAVGGRFAARHRPGTRLELFDPTPHGDFDQTVLRFADGSDVDDQALVSLNLLVRLARRLGWGLADTSEVLAALAPAGAAPADLPLTLAQLVWLADRLRVPPTRLLSLWGDLSPAEYAALFLTPAVLKVDDVFKRPPLWTGPGGDPEPAEPGTVADHLPGVRAALTLTADEVALILDDAGRQPAAEPLTVESLSLLHRYGVLARALDLPVAELVGLRQISGIDPFPPLATGPVGALDDLAPYQTRRFVSTVELLRSAGVGVTELDYLLRHRYDPAGPHGSGAAPPTGLVRRLAAVIGRVNAEHADPDDPDDLLKLTDAVLAEKLGLVFPADVVDTFLGMWQRTITYNAARPLPPGTEPVDPSPFAGEPAVRLDSGDGEQRLSYRGVLTESERDRLERLAHPPDAARVRQLLDDVRAQAVGFFGAHLQRDPGDRLGFLAAADLDDLFGPLATGADQQEQLAGRRRRLAKAFLPYLRDRLAEAAVVELVPADLAAEPEPAATLLTDPAVLAEPDRPGRPLADAFVAAATPGVTVALYASGRRVPLAVHTLRDATTAGLKEATRAEMAQISGWLEVPDTGTYRFVVRARAGGTEPVAVALRFAHLVDPLVDGDISRAGELAGYVELTAGVAYSFTLDATGLAGRGAVELLVQSQTLPEGSVRRLTCYPAATVDRVGRARTLLAKSLRLAEVGRLSADGLRHLAGHAGDFDGFDLSGLPTAAKDDPEGAQERFRWFARLAGYAQLHEELGLAGDELVELFRHAQRRIPAAAGGDPPTRPPVPGLPADPGKELLDDLCRRVGELLRRPASEVRAAAAHLGFAVSTRRDTGGGVVISADDFASERGVDRLWRLLRIVATLGVDVAAVTRWATPAPDRGTAEDLRDTLKARFDLATWRRMVRPVSDRLRQRRRDALVAFLLHKLPYERVEELYEHFLIDPATEPVVQTSRLRLAISSVQLFIQRCLLNLEKDVRPDDIESAQWEWMKRYRVWEANRKIFLYPENLLEPEFRDDKSHLFRELESDLLGGELTDELAEDALHTYLQGLEKIARLEIVSVAREENRHNPAVDVLHVLGRAPGTRDYYYRRWDGTWRPWEPVDLDIESDQVAAVVWEGRLHLFWLTVLPEPMEQDQGGKKLEELAEQTTDAMRPLHRLKVKLNWANHQNGEWVGRSSTDDFVNATSWPLPATGGAGTFRGNLRARTYEDDPGKVAISLASWFGWGTFSLNGRLATPEFDNDLPASGTPAPAIRPARRLKVRTAERREDNGQVDVVTQTIFRRGGPFTVRYSQLPVPAASTPQTEEKLRQTRNPFFSIDRDHTFFVRPRVVEMTLAEVEGFDPPDEVEEAPDESPGYFENQSHANQTAKDLAAEGSLHQFEEGPGIQDPTGPVSGALTDPGGQFRPNVIYDDLIITSGLTQHGQPLGSHVQPPRLADRGVVAGDGLVLDDLTLRELGLGGRDLGPRSRPGQR